MDRQGAPAASRAVATTARRPRARRRAGVLRRAANGPVPRVGPPTGGSAPGGTSFPRECGWCEGTVPGRVPAPAPRRFLPGRSLRVQSAPPQSGLHARGRVHARARRRRQRRDFQFSRQRVAEAVAVPRAGSNRPRDAEAAGRAVSDHHARSARLAAAEHRVRVPGGPARLERVAHRPGCAGALAWHARLARLLQHLRRDSAARAHLPSGRSAIRPQPRGDSQLRTVGEPLRRRPNDHRPDDSARRRAAHRRRRDAAGERFRSHGVRDREAAGVRSLRDDAWTPLAHGGRAAQTQRHSRAGTGADGRARRAVREGVSRHQHQLQRLTSWSARSFGPLSMCSSRRPAWCC